GVRDGGLPGPGRADEDDQAVLGHLRVARRGHTDSLMVRVPGSLVEALLGVVGERDGFARRQRTIMWPFFMWSTHCGQSSRGPSPAWASRLAYAWNQHCVHCPRGGFVAFALAISAGSLRVKGAGRPDQALPGVVGDQGGGLVQRAGGVSVAVGLDLLRTARGGDEQLRHGRGEAAGRVGVLDELAQDRGELLLVDVVGAKVVLDLLEGQRGDPDRGADAFQSRPGLAGHRVVALAVAMSAATVSQPW